MIMVMVTIIAITIVMAMTMTVHEIDVVTARVCFRVPFIPSCMLTPFYLNCVMCTWQSLLEAPFNVFGVRLETDPYEVVATIRIQVRTCP